MFDYQLGGPSPPDPEVTVVARDSTATPAAGIYSICYVNGFQTQPGATYPDELVLHDRTGAVLTDPGWPDEAIYDTSTDELRHRVADLLAPTVEGCRRAGFQAVELDNLDSWTRSAGALTEVDAVAFAALLVEGAHRAGLPVAQKNADELGARGRDEAGFDFAVTEECAQHDECSDYLEVYDGHVFDIEYTDQVTDTTELCARPGLAPSTILRDRQLTPPGTPGHHYTHC